MLIQVILQLVAVSAAIAFVLYGLPQAFRWFQVRRWNRRDGCIALTYDDGPDRQTTPQLLALLEEKGIKATFYLVGFRAELCPIEMEQLRQSGHELGAHSNKHFHAWKVAPWKEFADAHSGYRVLAPAVSATGPFRPPFGKVSLPTMLSMWLKGRRVQWWSIVTNDTDARLGDPDSIAERILDSGKPVILMHCHHDALENRVFVLQITRSLIDKGRERGLSFVTMSELASRIDKTLHVAT